MPRRSLVRLLTLSCFLISLTALSQSRPLITAPINNGIRAKVPKSHPLLSGAADLGALNAAEPLDRMMLVLGMAPEQQHQVAMLLDSQQTKGSPNYHHWLTPEQYGRQYGPEPEDVEQISNWLRQQGFTVGKVAKSGMWIEFSGTVGLANQAFHTQMHRYQVRGESHIANATDISIPSALTALVKGVPLHDFFSKPALVRTPVRPDITSSTGAHALTPGDVATIYDLAPLYKSNLNGTGQTIAIVGRSDVSLSDVAAFQKIFGLPNNVPTIIENGADTGVVPSGDGAEASIDVEWASAMAPGAKIELVSSANTGTTDGVALSATYIVDENLAQVVNASFSECETNLGTAGNAFWNNLWQQAAAQGMSVFVAGGDEGDTACYDLTTGYTQAVNGLSSTPFNTSVGGTEFDETGNDGTPATFWNSKNGSNLASAIGYIPEIVWNDGTNFGTPLATGGGISSIYPTPTWQTLDVTGLQVLGTFTLPGQPGMSPRGIPDVSLSASPFNDPYLFCFTDPFDLDTPDCQYDNGTFGPTTFQNAAGGTSFSSPIFAGMMAIINQEVQSQDPSPSPDPTGNGRQGVANYVLYPLAVSENFGNCDSSSRTNPTVAATAACVFNDVTAGNNTVFGVTGFSATTGYDLASGLGSVDASNLVTNWTSVAANFHGSETTLATKPAAGSVSISHGQSITFDVSVQKLTGDTTAQAPAGAVSFIAQGGTLGGSVGVASAVLSGSTSPSTTGNIKSNMLPGGSYNLIAKFPGDGFFAGSLSNTIPVTVTPENSTTSLYGFAQEPYGKQNEFNAIVTGITGVGYPTGQVTLADNSTVFAQLTLSNQGVASMNNCPPPGAIVTPIASPLPCFTVGTHVITAIYSGDGSFNSSPTPPAASQTITYIVTKGDPFISASAAITATGSSSLTTTLIADLGGVSPAAVQPTGTVQFFDGTTPLGQASVVLVKNFPQASLPPMVFSQGIHTVNVTYSGDSLYTSGEPQPFQLSVGVPFGWAANPATLAISPGQDATYNLTVTAVPGFTGTVPITCISGMGLIPIAVPPGVQCEVSPTSVTFTSTTTSAQVVATINTTGQSRLLGPFPFGILPFAFGAVFAMGLRKKRPMGMLVLFGVLVLAASGTTSCGSGGSNTPPPPTGPPAVSVTYTVWGAYPTSDPNTTGYNGIYLNTNIKQ
jgi:large repetitive protein